jgi:hypothetical protein
MRFCWRFSSRSGSGGLFLSLALLSPPPSLAMTKTFVFFSLQRMVFFPMNVCIILKSKALIYRAGNVFRYEEREKERERKERVPRRLVRFASNIAILLQHFFIRESCVSMHISR